MVENNTYSFDEIMERFDIRLDSGKCEGYLVKESKKVKRANPNMRDIARIGAVVMRLEDEIKRLI